MFTFSPPQCVKIFISEKGGSATNGFENIYKEYFPRIFAFLIKLTNDHSLAEELTQETFYRAYLSLHRFRGGSDIFTWLASIAKHVYFKHQKKQHVSMDEAYASLMQNAWSDLSDSNPETFLAKKEMGRAVRRAVAAIPEKHRSVVVLRAYADMSFREIGKSLGISESSAKVIYFRAKKKMMEELKNEYGM